VLKPGWPADAFRRTLDRLGDVEGERLESQRAIYDGRPELLGPAWAFDVETATHALRLIVSGLFDRFPNLTVVLGDPGEGCPSRPVVRRRADQRGGPREDRAVQRAAPCSRCSPAALVPSSA
jgi:hypothetical protein